MINKTAYFSTILKGRKTFVVCGPFMTLGEAIENLPDVENFDFENFPKNSMREMRYDYGDAKSVARCLSSSQVSKFGQISKISENSDLF